MDSEKRKEVIYSILSEHEKLTHNELWRMVQDKLKEECFSNKTFEIALKTLVDDNLIFREAGKRGNLKIVWYYVPWDFKKIENDIVEHFVYKLGYQNMRLKSLEKNFHKMNNYEKAKDWVSFQILFQINRASIDRINVVYSDVKNLKNSSKLINGLAKRLNRLLSELNAKDRKQVEQLIIRNLQLEESKLYQKILALKMH